MNFAANIWKLYLIKISKWFMVFMPVIVLFYQSNGLNLRQVMTINAIYSLTAALFEIPSGYFSDRFGRKNSIILGTLLIAAQFLAYSYSFTFCSFAAGAVIGGLGSSFISGSDSALLYDSLCILNRKGDYIKWEGRSYAIGTFSEAVAAIIGGTLAFHYGLRFPVFVQVGVSLIGVFAAISLAEPPQKKEHSRSNWDQIKYILTYTFKINKKLRFFLVITAMFGLASLLLAWFAQPYFDFKKIQENNIGYLWAALNLTVALFSYNAHRVRKFISDKILVFIILSGFSLGYILLGIFGGASLMFGLSAMFFMYSCRGLATPVFMNIINQNTPSEMRATVLSMRGFCVRILYAFIAPLMGWLADVFTVMEAFLLFGIVFASASVVAIGIYSLVLNNNISMEDVNLHDEPGL